jgi:hypothetical protein
LQTYFAQYSLYNRHVAGRHIGINEILLRHQLWSCQVVRESIRMRKIANCVRLLARKTPYIFQSSEKLFHPDESSLVRRTQDKVLLRSEKLICYLPCPLVKYFEKIS